MAGDHEHGATLRSSGGKHRRALILAFSLTAAYMVVEFVVGVATRSLALLSDAAHMGTDVIGLGMALAAITLAARERTPQRTYGLYRLEVLAALANGLLLIAVAGYVIWEAVGRFREPANVPGLPLLITAVVGLAVNIVSYRLLRSGAQESVNLKGASLEVLGDLLGSVGVIVAAVILLTTGWAYADPIVGVGVGIFILPRTVLLLRATLRILLEIAPPHLSVAAVAREMESVRGVIAVHDLHIWTITSGIDSASGHVVLNDEADYDATLTGILRVLRERFGIEHATIQCEPRSFAEPDGASPI